MGEGTVPDTNIVDGTIEIFTIIGGSNASVADGARNIEPCWCIKALLHTINKNATHRAIEGGGNMVPAAIRKVARSDREIVTPPIIDQLVRACKPEGIGLIAGAPVAPANNAEGTGCIRLNPGL